MNVKSVFTEPRRDSIPPDGYWPCRCVIGAIPVDDCVLFVSRRNGETWIFIFQNAVCGGQPPGFDALRRGYRYSWCILYETLPFGVSPFKVLLADAEVYNLVFERPICPEEL